MTEITDRDPTEMDHDDLRAEWDEAVERLRVGPENPEMDAHLVERRTELWNEMKERCDAEAPTCPECGCQRWSQVMGGPKACDNCDYHPTLEREELIQEIDAFWNNVLTNPQETEA